MKKRMILAIIFLVIIFSFVANVFAEDYNEGSDNTVITTGGGEWNDNPVAIRVSIVDENKNLKKAIRVLSNQKYISKGNEYSYCRPSIQSYKFNKNNKPKFLISDSDIINSWGNSSDYICTQYLPTSDGWLDYNNNVVNLYQHLYKNNYANLKGILSYKEFSDVLDVGDFIIIEPMTRIGDFFGTAFELANKYSIVAKPGECGEGTSCYKYSKAVFGGSRTNQKGGMFFTTIYLSENVTELGLNVFNPNEEAMAAEGEIYTNERNSRNDCFTNKTCGRGIGVFRYDDVYNNSLKINIKIKGTNTLITSSNATFEIYSGIGCSGAVVETLSTLMGTKSISLNVGTYSIKEIKQPNGYVQSNPTCVIDSTTIEKGLSTTEDIFYSSTCESELNNLDSNTSIEQRIEQLFNLYAKYEYRGLLNLSSPSCTANVSCNDSLSLNCLSGSNQTTFNESNLSCYNGDPLKDIYGNYIGFCQTSYNLINNLGVNKFYGKSGKLLITQNENTITIFQKKEKQLIEKIIEGKSIATGSTSKVCYSLNELNVDVINNLPQYNVYFGDNNNDKEADLLPNISNIDIKPKTLTSNGFNKYEIIETNDYLLNSLYLERITGKYSSMKTNATTNDPIYGVLSRFDTINGIIPFKVNNTTSNSCKFETDEEIIVTDKINLEYRIIDSNNPFNRIPKSNWNDGSNEMNSSNTIINKYIIESTNSYGLKQGIKQLPIYKIELTPNDVKNIREYNKVVPYDNYDVSCINDEKGIYVCKNKFIENLKNGKVILYDEKEKVDKTLFGNKLIYQP